MQSNVPRGSKRQRSASPDAPSSPLRPTLTRRDSDSSLPPSSPPAPFSDTDDGIDDRDAVRDAEGDEEEEGEDLFGENLEEDYAPNELLDRYSDADINDDEDLDELTPEARRAAELKMARRDRRDRAGKRGLRAARRSRAPAFLGSDDDMDEDDVMGDELGLSRMKARTRRAYDERRDMDDMDGIEDELPLEQLSDIKAKSIVEWIANERVRRSIVRHFRQFLMTYVDEQGASVYGQRIRNLGETNSESLEVSYLHLAISKPILAYFLTNSPTAMLEIFDEVALNAILVYYPSYQRIHSEVHVRISDLPLSSSLRDLRRTNLNSLVRVSGVVTRRSGVFPQLKCSTIIEANHVNKKEDLFAAFRLSEEDEKEIRNLARDERIRKRIIKSIAPSIYGHEDIKTAIALSLFGGVPKDINHKHRIRGDINVLLLGDPGTAKSQFLKYVEKTAHRSVFATGQGASAVGLTASVRKDPVTREWTLEGGALVLADKGTCLIDEFDKMNDADRTSIHEAMEQQSISISKAGIVTTLQARCAIIAAANPIRGRYNPTIPFQQNVELTEPILSRFDVLCVVKDTVDPVMDELLARFVVGSHLRSHPKFDQEMDEMNVATSVDEDVIPQDVLRKYIMYAREKVKPKLYDLDQEKLSKLFADLRRESMATGSYPITVRHLESMIRMAEASAKMALREYVRADDIDLAIEIAVGSFVNAQKMSIKKTLQRGFRKYLTQSKDHEELLAFLLGGMIKDNARLHQLRRHEQPEVVTVKLSDLEERAKEHDIFDIKPFLRSKVFATNGYKVKDRVIEKRFRVDRGD
ncbi:hypothetical protein C0993_000662 [Termitomyces sp. T159_Od127]|nr:hypothetical protein C0993_000662 [Termitomyces sp. T159_Od127]